MTNVKVVFGKEATQKILNNVELSIVELEQFQKSYSFTTEAEAQAFIKGINEAVAWQEVYVSEVALP
jgi:predicted metallopeptidase